MRYTIKQIARLAGVTPRTLHYYDEIGLMHPSSYGQNGYRYYNDESILQLQQILFFRELDFRLDQIKAILERPDFDLLQALHAHRQGLVERAGRLNALIVTVDKTIQHLQGEIEMNPEDFYTGFDETQQERYAAEAQQRWGETVASSQKRWKTYTTGEKNQILAHMHEITNGVVAGMDQGPQSPEVQAWIDRWYRHINTYFYDCSLEVFEALGHMYTQDPAFEQNYTRIHPGLAAFMEQAVSYYCKIKQDR